MKYLRFYLMVGFIGLALLGASASGAVSWTDWQQETAPAGPDLGTLTVGSTNVTVTHTGPRIDVWTTNGAAFQFNYPAFNTSTITNPPTSDSIQIQGGTTDIHTLSFSQAIQNPVLAIYSLGNGTQGAQFVFDTDFTILSSGSGYWGAPGSTLTKSGTTLNGVEGNGLIQFNGAMTSLSWTNPIYEYYYGVTVGVEGLAAPTVPVPGALCLVILGMGVATRYRRRLR